MQFQSSGIHSNMKRLRWTEYMRKGNFHTCRIILGILSAIFLMCVIVTKEQMDQMHSSAQKSFYTPNINSGQGEDIFTATHTKQYEKVMEERLNLLQQTCTEMQQSTIKIKWGEKDYLDNYVYDSSTNIAFCHIPKVASTWWFSVIAKTYGIKDNPTQQKKSIHEFMMPLTMKSKDLGPSIFKFVFVRDPLERLVSCFKNKYIKNKEPGFLNSLKQFLHKRAMRQGKKKFQEEISFSNFIDLVIEESKKGQISYGSLHWLPYYTTCKICRTKLHMIGKIETMREDTHFIIEKFPYLRDFVNLEEKLNSATNFTQNGDTTEHSRSPEFISYMDQLSIQQRLAICDIYRWDMKMFNYTCY